MDACVCVWLVLSAVCCSCSVSLSCDLSVCLSWRVEIWRLAVVVVFPRCILCLSVTFEPPKTRRTTRAQRTARYSEKILLNRVRHAVKPCFTLRCRSSVASRRCRST
jgi:hypothetical protein